MAQPTPPVPPAPRNVGEVFDDGAEGFAAWTPLLWDPVGAATVAAAGLAPGERVLDACCGAGSAAVPAGHAVGAEGRVDAVDLAARLLADGRGRAEREGLDQVAFHHADVTAWQPPDGRPYDAVLCVFGVFFLPDMDTAAARLLRLARPGGRFALTVWERGSLEPLTDPFGRATAAERAAAGLAPPARGPALSAYERLGDADGLTGWLRGLGAGAPAVRPFTLDIPLTPDLAWRFLTGAAPRAQLHGLDPAAVTRVREAFTADLAADGPAVFRASALIATGTRPSGCP
ncbi:class I SAM-dependent methyltransferase [Streptomyces sp. NPDC060194]|uniref:class I SAM-dependent methyltransferase n=1 Tax=Streptomyces sp. NPDC060194 TaxID=3347069 RepID=UPI00364F3E7F